MNDVPDDADSPHEFESIASHDLDEPDKGDGPPTEPYDPISVPDEEGATAPGDEPEPPPDTGPPADPTVPSEGS